MPRKFSKMTEQKITLNQAFDLFIEEKTANNLSKTTVRNYQQTMDAFIDYHDLPTSYLLEDVNISMVYKWVNHMKQNEVRPTSINHYLRDLRTFFNWAGANQYCEPLKITEIEAQEELPKMYTDEEIAIMLEKPRAGDSFSTWRSWAIINTVYATGLRASTLCNLTLGDIDFQKGDIIIERQKNKKAGILPLTPALANVLREYIKSWMGGLDDDCWLFPSSTSSDESINQLTVNALSHANNRYCADRGIKGHGVHSIRHNFARDMIVNGSGEFRLQQYLQHSSIQMSQHYVKLFSQDLKKDAVEYNPLDQLKKKASRTGRFKK